VCQFLDIIILCPKIYLDYFWCIKYQYIYRKGKRKGFSLLAGPGGDFGPAGRGRAAPRQNRPRRPTRRGDGAADAVGVGPRARERRGVTASVGRRAVFGGENRSPVNPTAVPRQWSGSVWTEWWQSTSGGRGSRRWSQFGRWMPGMAGPWRVAGSAAVRPPARPTGEIGKGEKVCRARGEVAELKSYTNLTRTQQRGEGGSSPEMKMTATLAQLSSGKGEEARGRGEELGSSGRSFYRRPGRGRGREVASTGELATTGMVVHSGDDGMARADGMA
jgi:hypothetical protein